MKVSGDIAMEVRHAFESMWNDEDSRQSQPKQTATSFPAAALIADFPGKERVEHVYEWLARHARHHLYSTDAYLVTPPEVLFAFEDAAKRGVDIRMLLPGCNNYPVVGTAAKRLYQPLMNAGVSIHEWEGMIHAKTAVMDEYLSLVGSSNLDPLSLKRNYEINLLVADPKTGSKMSSMFQEDLKNADHIKPEDWKNRPL